MKRLFRPLIVLMGLFAASIAQATPDPKVAVQTATDQLLAKLVEVQPLYQTEPEKFFSEVDTALAPFIDFDGFAKGVMAKYYRRASSAQQAKFIESFQTSLIKTYAKALVEFDNQKVVVLDPEVDPEKPTRANVALEIHAEDGTIYQVDYNLVLIEDRWLLRNVVINGINIGLQFRSQFANYMGKYRNDIDLVIENWSVDG